MLAPCSLVLPALPLIREPAEEPIKHESCLSHHYLQENMVITQTAAAEEQAGGEEGGWGVG